MPSCSVAVLYEDSATRDHAAMIILHLGQQLADQVRIEASWWRIDYLVDPRVAWEATEEALSAGMVVFALHAGREVPPVLRNWAETWVDSREGEPGAIVGLVGISAAPDNWVSPRHQYLQELAARARMDYLPQGYFNPDAVSAKAIAGVMDKVSTVTPVLKQILRQGSPAAGPPSQPTSHWGLNE